MPSPTRPLEGLIVVSLEQAVAAPMASRKLADAGARVIKLERPEGDFARGYDRVVLGQSSHFLWLNRGKQSVVVDLAEERDKRLLEALITRADVFVQNLKPGALSRLGFPPERLEAMNARLVQCSISGYGASGPYVSRKAYDLLIQAEAGLAAVTGGPEEPSRVGISVVDIATGMNAYEAILEALILRARTGRGARIEVSMFDSMAEWMAVPLLHGEHGTAPRRIGLSHPMIAPYGVFRSASGVPVLISIQNDREWRQFCRDVLSDETRADDPRFRRNVDRVEHRAATDALVAGRFGALQTAELIDLLNAADIAFGLVSEVADVLRHPCLRRLPIATPNGKTTVPAPPARVAGLEPLESAVPALGSHTEAVRREFLG
ncbi:MAG: CaiB/BaiF CoA-transferase family protein [Hyphomicrobiaceae bacterium]